MNNYQYSKLSILTRIFEIIIIKKITVILILVSFLSIVSAQNDEFVGKWKGEWSNAGGHYYTFDMDLDVDIRGNITGKYIWKLIKSPRSYERSKLGLTATANISGKYDTKSRKLTLYGKRADDPHNVIGDNGIYKLILSKNGKVLNGKSNDSDNSWSGVFYAIRKVKKENSIKNSEKLEGRKIITTQTINFTSENIIIKFWDDSREDGDIISLNLNGEWILRNFIVKKVKGEIVLNLIEGENILILHAENLGEVAPNTAAISLSEKGNVIKELTLNSDMGKSEAIKLIKENGKN